MNRYKNVLMVARKLILERDQYIYEKNLDLRLELLLLEIDPKDLKDRPWRNRKKRGNNEQV